MTIIEDWSEGSLPSYWTTVEGSGPTVVNKTIGSGTQYALGASNGNSGDCRIINTDESIPYPQQGSTFGYFSRPYVTQAPVHPEMMFAVQDANNYYAVRPLNLNIIKSSGGQRNTLASKDIDDPLDDRFIEISWDTDGTITVSIVDDSGSTQTVSTTDTEFNTGGIGFEVADTASKAGDLNNYVGDVEITQPAAPPAPSNVQVTDSSTEDEITLDWDAVSGATSYNVYRAQASGSSKSDYTLASEPTSPPYTDTGLEDGEQYFYRVASEN